MDDQRYPLRVRILGIMYKNNSKVRMHCDKYIRITRTRRMGIVTVCFVFQLYTASVLWSDQTEVIVYRTLREFKHLHVRTRICLLGKCINVARCSKTMNDQDNNDSSELLIRETSSTGLYSIQKSTELVCIHVVMLINKMHIFQSFSFSYNMFITLKNSLLYICIII